MDVRMRGVDDDEVQKLDEKKGQEAAPKLICERESIQ